MNIMTNTASRPLVLLRRLFIASIINMAMGVIYVWSIFLLPLEAELQVERAALSLIPALALVGFTIGMVVHDQLLRYFGKIGFAILAFGLAAGGHMLYAQVPSYWGLLIGYGICFGFGSGLGYGLALALATGTESRTRPLAVGITMASFALSGIVLPTLFGPLIAGAPTATSFSVISLAMVCASVLVVFVLFLSPDIRSDVSIRSGALPRQTFPIYSTSFFYLAIIFFLISCVGLLIVSQISGILTSNGLPRRSVDFGPSLFTIGYLLGSLFGGNVVQLLGGRWSLALSGLVAGLGLLGLSTGIIPLALGGAALVGLTFGGSASLMPVLIGEQFGADRIGAVYGRLMISYGLAGLLAPWLSGLLFSATGSYFAAMATGLTMCALIIVLSYLLKDSRDVAQV
jgi:MFS family permease